MYEEKLKWTKELCERVVVDYKPYVVLVGFTGGKDSNVALKLATMFLKVDAAFTCDTTIAAIETLKNCENVVKQEYRLPFVLKKPTYNGVTQNPNTYFELVKQHGFPGKTKTAHNWMYRYLKDHTLQSIISEFRQRKRNRPVLIVSGARVHESVRRMSTSQDITVVRNTIWLNICNQWTDSEVLAFAKDYNIQKYRSPISKLLGLSGECFCGAFSTKGELSELKFASPSTYEKIKFIEQWMKDNTDKHWGWEEGPPKDLKYIKAGQANLFDMMMCHTCMNNTTFKD